jgi:hypothetical protein
VRCYARDSKVRPEFGGNPTVILFFHAKDKTRKLD